MPSKLKRRGTPNVGDVFRIRLDDGFWGFGAVAEGGDCIFFALRSKGEPGMGEIVESPVAFRVFVAWDSFKNKGWEWIGHTPACGSISEPASYWHQSIGSNDLYIVKAGVHVPSNATDIAGLEQYSVWFDAHVEGRLNDYFAGRENAVHKAMSVVKRYDPETGQRLN